MTLAAWLKDLELFVVGIQQAVAKETGAGEAGACYPSHANRYTVCTLTPVVIMSAWTKLLGYIIIY